MKSRIRRRWIFGVIAIAVLMGLTLFAAPQSNTLYQGSTYNRSPNGYGAWYAYMTNEGTPAQRWEKTFSEFVELDADPPQTFLQISPPFGTRGLTDEQRAWVQRGNTWIILGEEGFPTEAPFTSEIPTEQHSIKIETSRRKVLKDENSAILGDRFGAILWEETVGEGRIIRSVTPFIGANAYQDEPGNFSYLADLVSENGDSIWVDELLHGYRDSEVTDTREAVVGDWVTYLSQTPFFPILIQAIVVMLVLIWAKNRRFGQPLAMSHPRPDNSEAYIQALAGVLEKAGRREFVVDIVGHEEQLQLQRALGLGSRRLDHATVIGAWVSQTGRPAEELETFLDTSQASSVTQRDLLVWIHHIKLLRDRSRSSGQRGTEM